MEVMMLSTAPEWEDIPQAPREIVPGMSIHCLMQAHADPDINGNDMEVLGQVAV